MNFVNPKVIVVGGLPGTGKTTLANALSEKLGISVYSKDLIEAAVIRSGIAKHNELKGVGYEIIATLTKNEVQHGRSVLLDCIAHTQRVNQYWSMFNRKDMLCIECVCSNRTVHRQRLQIRDRGITGWYEVTWKDVQKMEKHYKPCSEDRLIVDSMTEFKANVSNALKYLAGNVE